MEKLRTVLCVAVSACALNVVTPAAAPAAQDYFLEISGIKGESADAQFKDAIDVDSFSWGVSNDGKRAVFEDLAVSKRVDAASPLLLLRAASGRAIPTVKLSARQAGANPVVFLTFCLTNARVTSVSTAGTAAQSQIAEKVTFAYGTVVEIYRRQNPDGTLASPIVGGWDLIRNLQFGESC